MSNISIGSSNSTNYIESKVLDSKKANTIQTPNVNKVYSADTVINNKQDIVSKNPFEKSVNISKPVNNLKNTNSLENDLKVAREKNDSKALFDIAKIQYEKNIIPNISAGDILREAYETALSEMDSDTLYDIGNFDASKNLLSDVSSEHIFKMADMCRKIY
jgi:hypothetical protein